jgi:hypothetical protein
MTRTSEITRWPERAGAGLGLVALLFACRQPPPVEPAGGEAELGAEDAGEDQEAAAEEPARRLSAGSVVPVRALGPGDPASWRWDPEGRFVAAPIDGRCGLWSIASGHFGGTFPGPSADVAPCSEWPALVSLDDLESFGATRGSLRVDIRGGKLRVSEDDEARFEHECPNCEWVGLAIDGAGTRVAGAWRASRQRVGIRLFSADAGELIAELPLEGHEGREILDVDLAWGETLIALVEVVNYECHDLRDAPKARRPKPDPCAEPPFTTGTWIWSELDQPGDFEPYDELDGGGLRGAYVDPESRFMWTMVAEFWDREGLAYVLYPVALGEEETGIRWHRGPTGEDAEWGEEMGSRRAWWVGPETRYLESDAAQVMDDFVVSWTLAEPAPSPRVDHGSMFVLFPDGELDWRLHDARGNDGETERAALEYEVCLPSSYNAEEVAEMEEVYGISGRCDHQRLLPEGCELLGASLALDRVLGRCESRLVVDALTAKSGNPRTLLGLAGGGEDWLWTSAGLLALATGGEAILWDPRGEAERARIAGVEAIHHALLSEELGLALVQPAAGGGGERELAIHDLAAAKLLATIQAPPKPRYAAFSPTRAHLAVSDGREIAIYDTHSGDALARWTTTKVSGLAFRQDGAVLFTGEHRPLPERAWSVESGERLDDAELGERLLERLAAGELDPSWRWSVHADGWITRTLDGRELFVEASLALSDNGLMHGDPAELYEYRLRVGPDPRSPVFEPEQLYALLEHPDLVKDFFAGAPLPSPELDEAEIAAALAGEGDPAD